MNTDKARKKVFEHLERRDQIQAATNDAIRLAEIERAPLDPLIDVEPSLLAQIEDEYYARSGRIRHVSSNGRVLWLTEEQISERKGRRKKEKTQKTYYGPLANMERRDMIGWAFRFGAILLALVIVYLIVL